MIRGALGGAVVAAAGLAAAAVAAEIGLGAGARRDGRRGIRPITQSVEIAAPQSRVWTALSDIPSQVRWMREMKAVRLLTDGPTGVGTRGEATVRIFGISVTDPVEIVEWDPPHAFAIRHEGRFGGGGRLTLMPGVDGTTTIVRWREILVPPLLPRLGSLAQAPVLGWIFQDDLYRFRDLVEAGQL